MHIMYYEIIAKYSWINNYDLNAKCFEKSLFLDLLSSKLQNKATTVIDICFRVVTVTVCRGRCHNES